jgi:hypothetical protein
MTKPKAEPRTNIRELQPAGEALVYNVIYKARRFRYLFDGGDVCDVIAVYDDSDLRRVILEVTKQAGIVGVAIVEELADSVEYMPGPV